MCEFELGGGLQGPSRGGPTVHAVSSRLLLRRLWFASPTHPQLYVNGSTHPTVKEPLQGWALGKFINDADWEGGRKHNYPGMLIRGKPVQVMLGFIWKPGTVISGTLEVTPRLLGSHPYSGNLTKATKSFRSSLNQKVMSIFIDLGGKCPDVVGRFDLELSWKVTPDPGSAFSFGLQGQTSNKTVHRVYCAYDPPLDPGKEPSTPTPIDTNSATPKRLEKLVALLGSKRYLACSTAADLHQLVWEVHKGISALSPPYFDNALDLHITHDGTPQRVYGSHGWIGTGKFINIEDQWLMWVPNSKKWNRASCIGHVQLLKTMLATVGIYIRRSLVLPVTNVLPPTVPGGSSRTLPLSEIQSKYLEGSVKRHPTALNMYVTDVSNRLTVKLRAPGESAPLDAWVALMKHGKNGEYFEACAVAPGGKYLPGAFEVNRVKRGASGFVSNQGFGSALEALRWWARTKSNRGQFQRFLCWVHVSGGSLAHCWDRNGKYYPPDQYVQIRNQGLDLPVP